MENAVFHTLGKVNRHRPRRRPRARVRTHTRRRSVDKNILHRTAPRDAPTDAFCARRDVDHPPVRVSTRHRQSNRRGARLAHRHSRASASTPPSPQPARSTRRILSRAHVSRRASRAIRARRARAIIRSHRGEPTNAPRARRRRTARRLVLERGLVDGATDADGSLARLARARSRQRVRERSSSASGR